MEKMWTVAVGAARSEILVVFVTQPLSVEGVEEDRGLPSVTAAGVPFPCCLSLHVHGLA